MCPWHLDIDQPNIEHRQEMKQPQRLQLFSVTSLSRCHAASATETGGSSCWCPRRPTWGQRWPASRFLRSAPKHPGANKSPDDWFVPIHSRRSPKQIDTIQGAAGKQDEPVSLSKQQAAYSQGQEPRRAAFSTVCLLETSTLTRRATLPVRSNPAVGLLWPWRSLSVEALFFTCLPYLHDLHIFYSSFCSSFLYLH